MTRKRSSILAFMASILAAAACGGGAESSTGGAGGSGAGGASTGGASTSSNSGSSSSSSGTTTVDCSGTTTKIEEAVCAANALLASAPSSQLATLNPAYSESAGRTKWNNLPVQMKPRAGVQLASLDAASQAAALDLMSVVLSTKGKDDTLDGIRAADEYLGTMQSGYGSGLYSIAIFGTPSTTGNWEILFGGHHMAFAVNYVGGVGYPTPNHIAVEPKAEFTLNGVTYAPLADEAAAMVAVFDSLSSAQLTSAYLAGQSFGDVLVGPVEYDTGSSSAAKAKFPTGANRTGARVSDLDAGQQALVTAAIEAWVRNFEASIADKLVADYTSSAAYADTYVAFAGSSASGVNVDQSGTYMRIDGPRVWIEIACQGGIVIQGKTHYHTIYRDKELDYGGTI